MWLRLAEGFGYTPLSTSSSKNENGWRCMVLSKQLLSLTTALALGACMGWTLAAQDKAGDKPAKNWKDRAEYDLADAANKAAAKERIAALDKWKQQYPTTEYADEREDMYLITYSEL